jgi:hypothetical protein
MAGKTEPPAIHAKPNIAELLIACVIGLMLTFTALFLGVMPLTDMAGKRDFVVYWATGQQLVHHGNPYDKDAVMRIERSAGLPTEAGTLYMRNLPWSLPLAVPLGFIGLRPAAILWTLALLACLVVSVRILWRMHGRTRNYLPWLGVSFAPAMLCLTMGQTSLFALLGYVLFLDLHRRRPFMAGASLCLCALKPHLFLAFGVVLLAWILITRNYKILAGSGVGLAASCVAVSCIDPKAWIQYAQMMQTTGFVTEHVPCLSVALRVWLSPQTMVLTYVPAVLGCAWALGYFWSRRKAWDWMKDGSLLMLVSLLTAPYSWVYDDCLAIPALLHGAYLTRSRILLGVLALASVLIMTELVCGIKLPTAFYLWTTPAWLAWYLLACASARRPQAGEPLPQYREISRPSLFYDADVNSSVSPGCVCVARITPGGSSSTE